MTYPTTIEEVEALESKFQESNIDLNNYWHLTTEMKVVIACKGEEAKESIARLILELEAGPKSSWVKPEPRKVGRPRKVVELPISSSTI